MVRALTKLEFIEKAKAIHGNKYSYNKVIYKNRTTKIQIFCKKCKEYFLQTPNGHLRGCGCKKCGYKSHSLQLKDSFCEFIEKAKKIHDKIKQNFCKVNKIGLLIIKYDANINDILKKELIYDEGNL